MLDPMTVYGELENYQSWPLSASAVSGEDIAVQNRTDQRTLAEVIPNFSNTDTGLRAFGDVVSMRGLTNTPFFGDPSVVQYVDDVPMGNVFSLTNQFHAVDRAEVFRGPQGWLFGQNAYGGAVNVISRRPSDVWEGQVSGLYGSYQSVGADGFVMGPLAQDKLYLRLGGNFSERNGFLFNPNLGTHPDEQRHASGSGALYWKPNSDWEVMLSATVSRFNDGAPRLSSLDGDPFTVTSDVLGEARQESNSQALRIAYEGSDFTFLSVTSRRYWEIDPYHFDLDLSAFPGNESFITQDQELYSQEFRLSSLEGGDWEWSLGAYLSGSEVEGNTTRNFIVPTPDGNFFPATTTTDYTIDSKTYALYGQVSYHGIDRVGVHAGLRFDYVEKDLDRDATGLMGPVPNNDLNDDYFFVSPRLGLDYELDESSLVYVTTALAFKPGGFSAFVDDPSLAPYDEERAWTTELGWKKSWLDDAVRTNVALFYSYIHDYQVERSLVATDYAVLNADRAQSYGAEVEFQARLFDGFTLEGSLGVVKTEFDRFTDPLTGADLSGNRAPFVPEIDASLSGTYRHSSGLFARVELFYQGQTYFDDFNNGDFREPGYTLVNAALGYETDQFQLSVFGRNITDQVYYQNISPDLRAGTVGAPAVFGVRCQYSF